MSRPVGLFSGDCRDGLHALVRERLREEYGVIVKSTSMNGGGVKKQRLGFAAAGVGMGTPAALRTASRTRTNMVFGRPLRDLVPDARILDGHSVIVPHFLSTILDYLTGHQQTEGIFRKAGSAARQKSIRFAIEAAGTFVVPPEDVSALDVASLLKQWLRELPEPLIPVPIQEALLSCIKLPEGEREAAMVLCTLLMPPLHSACLSCLARFLFEVQACSDTNKMSSKSLAIVFTPGLFPESGYHSKKLGQRIDVKVEIVGTLINGASKVGMVEEVVTDVLTFDCASFATSMSEDNLDGPEEVNGPSARRRKKKKRRSGSLSRVFTATMKGLHKAIGRSTTPARTRWSQELDASERKRGRSPAKLVKTGPDSMITPKVVRGRSIKNRFRSCKRPEASLTPVAAAKSLNMALTPVTPGTPGSLIPNPTKDLSFNSSQSSPYKRRNGSRSASVSAAASTFFERSSPPSKSKFGHLSPSSSKKKIGNTKCRSREMTKQLSSKVVSRQPTLRRGQPNTFVVRPSPLKVEKTSPSGERTTRIKMSFKEGQIQRPRVQISLRRTSISESLTNLRSDISSLIEKSFGARKAYDSVGSEEGRMRRQSSAFEFSHTNADCLPSAGTIRRQSSAFELAAKKKNGHMSKTSAASVAAHVKAASVKDLVKKLEGVDFAPLLLGPAPLQGLMEDSDDMKEEWTDAKEFLDKTPINRRVLDDIGCKRSSILRIRKEKKGLVSKNVETFTNPEFKRQSSNSIVATTVMGPPPSRTTQTPKRPLSERRLSARMGVAGSTRTPSLPPPPKTSNPRRQTLTGIKTTTTPSFKTPQKVLKPMRDCKHPSSIKKQFTDVMPIVTISSPTVTTLSSNKRVKRMEERRHLTIGYEGEVRSPLKEKQNLIASVQRSKSAQTPMTRRGGGQRSSPYRKPTNRGGRTVPDENNDMKKTGTTLHCTKLALTSPAVRKSPRFT